MTEQIIRASRFEFKSAIGQVFNLPGGKGYLFRVLAAATAILLLSFLLLGYPIIKAYISMFQNIMAIDAMAAGTEPDPAMIFAIIQPIFAVMGYFTLLYVVQYGAFIATETALYRNIIRGEDRGLFPLWFGHDEWRVLGTRIVVGLIIYAILMVAYIAMAIVLGLLIGLSSVIFSAESMALFGGLVFFVALLVLMVAMIYISVRFAPAAAISVRDEQFSPLSSWKMMRTYVWPTFGAVLVVGLIGYFALSIFSAIAFGVLLYASGLIQFLMAQDFESNTIPDFSPLLESVSSAGFIIPAILVLVISLFLSLLYMSAIWSIWGYIAKLTDWRDF